MVKLLETYKKFPLALTTMEVGPVANVVPAGMVEKGEPVTSVRLPLLMENTETVLDPWLATNRNFPAESIAIPMGMTPVFGAPLTAVREPSTFTV